MDYGPTYRVCFASRGEVLIVVLCGGDKSSPARGIADAMGVVAKACGMTQLSRGPGLARPALYRALCANGRPEFATVLKVLHAPGVRLTPEAASNRLPGAAT